MMTQTHSGKIYSVARTYLLHPMKLFGALLSLLLLLSSPMPVLDSPYLLLLPDRSGAGVESTGHRMHARGKTNYHGAAGSAERGDWGLLPSGSRALGTWQEKGYPPLWAPL